MTRRRGAVGGVGCGDGVLVGDEGGGRSRSGGLAVAVAVGEGEGAFESRALRGVWRRWDRVLNGMDRRMRKVEGGDT